MSEHRTAVGPTVSWNCPACGNHVETHKIVGWDSLDAAWAEAEAALPERWMVRLEGGLDHYLARAAEYEYEGAVSGAGPAPAAALRALAAKLRSLPVMDRREAGR